MNWHSLDIDTTLTETHSSREGLSPQTAEERLQQYGPNELKEKKKKPAWLMFLLQFKDFMIVILVVAAIVSGIAGDIADTFIILVIVLLNAILGFIQEYRAEKGMEALKQMSTPYTHVLRNKQHVNISSTELVPGDIVLLEAGNVVPADLRLMEVHSLRIEESSLTGESVPVDKHIHVIEQNDLPLGDRLNMAYKGTLVTNGRGKGIVIATGMKTELGNIAGMLQEKESLTPLQKRMADFGRKLSYIILLICIVLFVVGLLRGEKPIEMLLVAISLAVAAIPEALPALITIALARGAKRLIKKNALMRKLPAVETLGSVTFICTDKTGTLTQNKMKVIEVHPAPATVTVEENIPLLHLCMALNHDVKKTEDNILLGDPTEIALVEYFLQQHDQHFYTEIKQRYKRKAELPFDSERKCMTTIHQFNNEFLSITKGAAEVITAKLKEKKLQEAIIKESNALASKGVRVLAYGIRLFDKIPDHHQHDDIETELEFAGLVGMIDPPREEAKKAIQECKTAGIHPVMITGDHRETATAIAKEIGILDKNHLVVTGRELNAMSQSELVDKVEKISVYARVSPQQKLNIVKALQQKNHFVAMTGDGVNDAPSLKIANIGIAMGITGTDVSKEASHMILLDDNFATIVKAVKEGRRIYDNIRKFVKYIMTCNGAEIWTIFLAPLIGLPIPLQPVHILWINLVTDGLPGLALSAEGAEKNIMQRPPRKPNESLFAEGIGYHIVWVGVLMAAITLGTQAWAIHIGDTHWQTMVFTVLSLAQLSHVFAIRSDNEFIFRKGIFSNVPLVAAVGGTFILQMAVIYLPYANKIFKTQPLTINELLICFAVSSIIFFAVEAEKWIKKLMR